MYFGLTGLCERWKPSSLFLSLSTIRKRKS